MPSTFLPPHTIGRRASGESESSSLLPLWIILGVGVALAIGWFALSSCLGDNAREALADRIRGLFSRNRGGGGGGAAGSGGAGGSRYGRMRDDEAEAFDINAAEHDLYDDYNAPHQPYDQGYSSYPPTAGGGGSSSSSSNKAGAGTSKYDDVEDDLYDHRQP